jgi:hypothetical protein
MHGTEASIGSAPSRIGEQLALITHGQIDHHLAWAGDRADRVAQRAEVVVGYAEQGQLVRGFQTEFRRGECDRTERANELCEILGRHLLGDALEDPLPSAFEARHHLVTHTLIHMCS